MPEILRGYLVASLCGWAALPLLARLLPMLPDGGYSLCRTFGVALCGSVTWAAAALLRRPLDAPVGLGAVAIVALFSAAAWRLPRRRRAPAAPRGGEDVAGFARRIAGPAALGEALFAGGLLLFGWIQARNPAIDPDSERFMDHAFLNALLRSPGLPVADPWFAGKEAAYYTFGYALVAFLVRTGGADPARFFTTAVALQHALLWSAVFGAGGALAKRARGGLVAAFVVLGAGNFEWIRQGARHGLAAFDWFAPSRVIAGAISEFPWFSLLWGDLHPYVIALPMVACALAFVLADVGGPHGPDRRPGAWETSRAATALRLACFGLLAGAVVATHPWDFPILLFAAVAASLVPGGGRGRRAASVAIAGVAFVPVFLPFLAGLDPRGRGAGRVAARSGSGEWLMAFGPFVVLLLLWGASVGWRRRADRGHAPGPERAALVLAGCGLATALACEVIYVRDLFEPTDLARMNTVFKIHRLAWLLLGVAAPVLAFRVARRRAGAAALVILAGASAVYPVRGTAAWLRARSGEATRADDPAVRDALSPGADAAALFRALDPGGAAAAEFIARTAVPGEALLEETGDPYTWSARLSTFTGVPSVLGWGNHEAIWRQGWGEVLARAADVEAIYRDPGAAATCERLRRYGVRWIVVGERERSRYGVAVDGFARLATPAFSSRGTRVFDARGVCG